MPLVTGGIFAFAEMGAQIGDTKVEAPDQQYNSHYSDHCRYCSAEFVAKVFT